MKNKYLVLVLQEFCLDGQIVANEYCNDRMDSDEIDIYDYDKRDFTGDFSLGTFEASSNEEVIRIVSEAYQMEEEMLKAYKLG